MLIIWDPPLQNPLVPTEWFSRPIVSMRALSRIRALRGITLWDARGLRRWVRGDWRIECRGCVVSRVYRIGLREQVVSDIKATAYGAVIWIGSIAAGVDQWKGLLDRPNITLECPKTQSNVYVLHGHEPWKFACERKCLCLHVYKASFCTWCLCPILPHSS